ncbi:uncharacterized protein LOC128216745 isoform X2 [Mya arenaria]|uniref:uncharacterized protein LOC128216745 isoform X2 n=1 Tax=Mya arenaria TaxID=6604 RepID=UPI0022E0C1E6|nr:uncharacterized protein LOC128216745 isoform X2 [Mya arenaria]
MDYHETNRTISVKDLTEKQHVTVKGSGEFFIGLDKGGVLVSDRERESVRVPLVRMEIQGSGGCVLAADNSDLPLVDNREDELAGEINMVDGLILHIAGRKLEFVVGPVVRPRRKLPRTPGNVIPDRPPPKPARASSATKKVVTDQAPPTSKVDLHESQPQEKTDDGVGQEWELLEDSCRVLPESEAEQLRTLDAPEKISVLAASRFTQQLRMSTDAVVTPKLLDDIFRLFTDTVDDCHEDYLEFLREMPAIRRPVPKGQLACHAPAVRLLTVLLKYSMEPVASVALLLDLLRTFSHFPANFPFMARYGTAAAVLGSMAAHGEAVKVQRNGADILARLALYCPAPGQKAPVREAAVDVLVRGSIRHQVDSDLSRAVCRTLANLAATLVKHIDNKLERVSHVDPRSDVLDAMERQESLLTYVFQEGVPAVQAAMTTLSTDLGVITEGRKFIFYYAKLPQLQQKIAKWKLESSGTDLTDARVDDDNSTSTSITSSVEPRRLLIAEMRHEQPEGILKASHHTGASDNSNQKRIVFADDTTGGTDSEDFSSEEEELSPDKQSFMQNETCQNTVIAQQVPTPGVSGGSPDESMEGSKYISNNAESLAEKEGQSDPFTGAIVRHLVRKSIRQRSHTAQPDDSDSSSEDELLQSLSGTTESASCQESKERISIKSDYGTEQYDDSKRGDADERRCEPPGTVSDHSGTLTADSPGHLFRDVDFLGKFVRTQIIVHVGSLVLQGEDTLVLSVIDQPLPSLLAAASAPSDFLEFAARHWGPEVTLMDLDPALIISVIDAVRYTSVTTDLVKSAMLDITRSVCEHAQLQAQTSGWLLDFYRRAFADKVLRSTLTDTTFLQSFREIFKTAAEKLDPLTSLDCLLEHNDGDDDETQAV